MGIGQTRRTHDLLTGSLRIGESDVLAHGAAEQQRILRNDADLATQGIQLDLVDVVTIDENSALLWGIETRQKLHQSALAAAALPDDADKGAGLDLKVDVLENFRLAGPESEREILEAHLTFQRRKHHF